MRLPKKIQIRRLRAGLIRWRLALLAAITTWVISAGRAASTDLANTYAAVDAIFAKHCLDCHGTAEPEANLVLENYESLLLGSENGAVIKPGRSAESYLIEMVAGTGGKKKLMPPGKRDKLNDSEIQTLKSWIDAGAPPPPKGVLFTRKLNIPKIEPLHPPRRPINALAFDSESKWAALARYGEVELVSTEEQEVVRTLTGLRGNVNAVVFSSSGKELFAAGGENALFGEVREYSLPEGKLIRTFEGHRDAIFSIALSPDGKTLATGSYDQKIKLWDVAGGKELKTLSGHNGAVFGLAFRPDGKVLASASSDRTVKLWDAVAGARLDTLSQSLKDLYAVAFSPDGKRLAAAGGDNRIRVWEVGMSARETPPPVISRFAHEGTILRLAYSSDGKWILSSAQDLTLKLWTAATLEEKTLYEKQPDWPSAIAFGEGNSSIIIGRLDGTLSFYDTLSGSVIKPPAPSLTSVEPRGIRSGVVTKLLLSGRHLTRLKAASSDDGKLKAKLATPEADGKKAWVEVEPPGDLRRGSYQIRVSNPNGESGWMSVWVDELPQLQMKDKSADKVEIPELPAMVWGTINRRGDIKSIDFKAGKGETIVFDPDSQMIGSKAKLNLALEDEDGNLLSHSEGFGSRSAPLLAYTFKDSGLYRLVVSEAMMEGSSDDYFRVAIGTFPCVTGFFPLGVAKGATSQVQLIGYNLPTNSIVTVHPAEAGEIELPFDPAVYRSLALPKLLVANDTGYTESEPNDTPAQANEVSAPCVVNGRLWSEEGKTDSDFFRFHAAQGERIVIETAAAQRGSPADTKIEILHADGTPVHRALLQATRDSHITFRGFDSNADDARLESWEEMEIDQYLYMEGEVCRLNRAPQGPDSGYGFYALQGKRRTYFGTSSIAHAFDEPCYIVEPLPPGSKRLANGLPAFLLDYVNDDDDERRLGSDSRLVFVSPTDGDYLVRVSDSRNFQGELFSYRLILREAKPDFKVTLDGANPSVPPGSGVGFSVRADRIDGFEGEIKVEITGLPAGFQVSNPLVIQADQLEASGVLYAGENAQWPDEKHPVKTKVTAQAIVDGKLVAKTLNDLGEIKRGTKPKVQVALEPDVPEPVTGHSAMSKPVELTISPGESIPARIKVRRAGFDELLTFSVENLPHGIIVDNIGLNGVLIPKGQDERQVFISAAKWVPESDRLCYAVENQAGRQSSPPVLLHVRKKGWMKPTDAVASTQSGTPPASSAR